MCLSNLFWSGLLVCILPLSACERAASRDGAKASSAQDTVAQTSRDASEVPPADTILQELPGDTVKTLVVDSVASEPRLEAVGTGYVLRMPTRMHEALQAKAPGFESLRRGEYNPEVRVILRPMNHAEALFAVVGDFDGDGRKDAVVHGAIDSAIVLIAVLNRRSRVHALEIPDGRENVRNRRYRSRYLVHHRPGLIHSPMQAKPLRLRRDAFGLVSDKGGFLYYYRDGRFVEWQTGD